MNRKAPRWARLLRQSRTNASINQTFAGAAIGVDQSMISKFENGRSLPSIEQYMELCNLYGIEIWQISFFGEDRLNAFGGVND